MNYEWDEAKRAANLAKHGVDFGSVVEFDWDTALETIDDRFNYGETRWVALGNIGRRLHVMIYTQRAESIRVVSLRRANSRERKHYETQTRKY